MSKIRPGAPSDNVKDRRTYRERIEQAFPSLCNGLAQDYSAGKCTFQQAVDWCQDWAFTRGLVDLVGQDEVQRIMAQAFLPYRKDLQP